MAKSRRKLSTSQLRKRSNMKIIVDLFFLYQMGELRRKTILYYCSFKWLDLVLCTSENIFCVVSSYPFLGALVCCEWTELLRWLAEMVWLVGYGLVSSPLHQSFFTLWIRFALRNHIFLIIYINCCVYSSTPHHSCINCCTRKINYYSLF